MKLSKDSLDMVRNRARLWRAEVELKRQEEAVIHEITGRLEVLPWCNGSWRFLDKEPCRLEIAKRQWADDVGHYMLQIEFEGLNLRALRF
jgi:hypothetical protein